MSLLKKRRMTAKRLAAIRQNQKLSRGPATPAGRERIRDTHLRHGFYSMTDEAALRALGEDPADFREVLDGLVNPGTAAGEVQECLGERLARAYWRMKRAERMQEGYALRQAKQEECTREGRLHMQMMRLKMVSRSWQRLAQSVARPKYVTTRADLDFMRKLHQDGGAKEMSEVALALFYQLREPGLPMPGDPDFHDREEYEKAQRVVAQVKEIFGIGMTQQPKVNPGVEAQQGTPLQVGQQQAGGTEQNDAGTKAKQADPYPNVTEEQWAAREPVRQLLENLLTRQVEIFEAQHRALLRESVAGPSPQERAAEIVPTHPNSLLMQRMEDSNFRQMARLTSLIIRMKRLERLRVKSKEIPV